MYLREMREGIRKEVPVRRTLQSNSVGMLLATALAAQAAQAAGRAPAPAQAPKPAEPEPLQVLHGYVQTGGDGGGSFWFQIVYKERVLEHVTNHTDQFEAGRHCERLLRKWRKESNLDAAAKNKARLRPLCSQCGGSVRGAGITVGNDTFCGNCKP
jgi:hypothetical protein